MGEKLDIKNSANRRRRGKDKQQHETEETSEESEQLDGWDDFWNVKAEAYQFRRHIDATRREAYEDIFDMTK